MAIPIRHNTPALMIARRRWLRRLGIFSTPDYGWVGWRGRRFHVYLGDWRGPSYHVMHWGLETYEPRNVEILRRVLPTGGVFFDVGANVGIISIQLGADRELDATIHAFEPESHALECLSRTVADGDLANITILSFALSDQDGETTFYIDGDNHGGHSANRRAIVEENDRVSGEMTVETRRLDTYMAQQGLTRLDLIKLDVQRHEYEVLDGARETLRGLRPAVMMECYHEDMVGERSLMTFFHDLDYLVYEPESRLLAPATPGLDVDALFRRDSRYTDLLLIPEERREDITAEESTGPVTP